MGETLRSLGAWFKDGMLPYTVIHRFTIQLVLALDYVHYEKIIHTDINRTTCLSSSEISPSSSLGILPTSLFPQQDKYEERYSPISSRPLRRFYFNETDSKRVREFDVVLSDWDVSSWTTNT